MDKGNKTTRPELLHEQPQITTNAEKNSKDRQADEGDVEIDILRLIKVKSRRVNSKVILAILMVLLFVWLLIKW